MRKEALEALEKLASNPKLEGAQYGELTGALKKVSTPSFLFCFLNLMRMEVKANLVPRVSLLPVQRSERERERPWFGLVTCLPDFSRLQTNNWREGQVRGKFVST